MAGKSVIYTIGHSIVPLLDFVSLLDFWGIEAIVDVRSKPFSSRHPHFSKLNLHGTCNMKSIEYKWLGKSLGGLGTISIKDEFFVQGIDIICDLSKTKKVALMCSEREPDNCHRAMKLTPVLLKRGHTVRHLVNKTQTDGEEFQQECPTKGFWHEFGGNYGKENVESNQLKLF